MQDAYNRTTSKFYSWVGLNRLLWTIFKMTCFSHFEQQALVNLLMPRPHFVAR